MLAPHWVRLSTAFWHWKFQRTDRFYVVIHLQAPLAESHNFQSNLFSTFIAANDLLLYIMLREEGDGQNRVFQITHIFTRFQSLQCGMLLAFLLTNDCKVILNATILAVFNISWTRTILMNFPVIFTVPCFGFVLLLASFLFGVFSFSRLMLKLDFPWDGFLNW